ncbi:MAG: alpha/beta hydrolase [Sphingomonadales bacterium]
MDENSVSYLETGSGRRLAYASSPGRGPGVIFLGGFKSDMTGTKAVALERHCQLRQRAYLRFDYSGHGQSHGRFEDGTISVWLEDALAALDDLTAGPQILVGSSMGGWLALLAALARPQRVRGLVLIAPAPDFTRWGIAERLNPEQRAALERDGMFVQPSDYGEPYAISRALLEDGQRHGLLQGSINIDVPVRILQGQRDREVPWQLAPELAERLISEDVVISLVKAGDHRLSTDGDIDRLTHHVDTLASYVG